MTWIAVIALALACFVFVAVAFRLPRGSWTVLGAALALGLAGYSLQARPTLPASPGVSLSEADESMWQNVETRREFIETRDYSNADMLMLADAMGRRGRQVDAAAFLRQIVAENPQDFEAWLALGNAMVAQTGGQLTPAAMLAYRRASEIRPDSLAPSYSVGLAMVMEGQIMDGRQAWADALELAPEDAQGRDVLADRLLRLDELIERIRTAQTASPD